MSRMRFRCQVRTCTARHGEQYQVYVLETGVTEETEIRAVEIRPENGAIAHHALIGYAKVNVDGARPWMADARGGYRKLRRLRRAGRDFLFGKMGTRR